MRRRRLRQRCHLAPSRWCCGSRRQQQQIQQQQIQQQRIQHQQQQQQQQQQVAATKTAPWWSTPCSRAGCALTSARACSSCLTACAACASPAAKVCVCVCVCVWCVCARARAGGAACCVRRALHSVARAASVLCGGCQDAPNHTTVCTPHASPARLHPRGRHGSGQDAARHHAHVDAAAAGCPGPGWCAGCTAHHHRVPHVTRQQLGLGV
jgi:hypothetical protein